MNTIAATPHQTLYAAQPHLHLFIDGQPLDELLHQYYPEDNYQGLVPTLLSWLDRPDERQGVWERATLHSNNCVKLPLLMCPDDLDLSCTVVAAEVVIEEEIVRWTRIGWDATTSPDPADCCREMQWLPLIPAFAFNRAEYQRCLAAFAAVLDQPE